MKKRLIPIILAIPLALVACGQSEPEEPSAASSDEMDLVSASGGEEEIRYIAGHANEFCHEETTYDDIPLSESPYVANEFQAAYIEEDGNYIRHVIAGTVDVEDSEGTVLPVGYSCVYLQRETKNAPAVQDNLGIVFEDVAVEESAGGYSLAELRETLRDFHDVGDDREEVVISTNSYSEASRGWIDRSQSGQKDTSEKATPAAEEVSETAPTNEPLDFMIDGTYRVGVDVEPGTYESSEAGNSCYWARLSGLSGENSDIIANDARAVSPIVTIQETDVAFQARNCGLWMQVE